MPPLPRVALCASFLGLASVLAAQAQTNTLLLIADDVGIDAVGAYGVSTPAPPTPNLDQLAREGILFRHAHANPLCSTTRATIHTGRYSFRTGIGWVVAPGEQGLPLAEHTLPEVLNANATAHALFGKWHLGDRASNAPNLHGWSHFAGVLGSQVYDYGLWWKTTNGRHALTTNYAVSEIVDDALAWIGSQSAAWVCVVSFPAAHTPLHAPPPQLHTQRLTGRDPSRTPALFYRAMVETMDREIGRLLETLPETVRARTNVIFVGDNGTPGDVIQAPFDPMRGKGTLYEGGTWVPLLVSGPAVVAPGREVDALVDTVDLFPTIAELQGVDARAVVPASVPLDGISIVPYLGNPTETPRREVSYTELFALPTWPAGYTVCDGRWKLLRTTLPQREELYDLANDPFERIDLWTSSPTPEARAAYDRLRRAAARVRGESLALPFGTGCAGSAGVPVLAATKEGPRPGVPLALAVTGLAPGATATFAHLGLSNTAFGGHALPLDLGVLHMPQCTLFVSCDLVVPMSVPAARQSVLEFGIPADPALTGGTFFVQASVVEPGANPAGVILTRALATVIGR